VPACYRCEAHEAGIRKDEDGRRTYKRTPIKTADIGGDSPYELPEEKHLREQRQNQVDGSAQCPSCGTWGVETCKRCHTKLAYDYAPDFLVHHQPVTKVLRWATTGVA